MKVTKAIDVLKKFVNEIKKQQQIDDEVQLAIQKLTSLVTDQCNNCAGGLHGFCSDPFCKCR